MKKKNEIQISILEIKEKSFNFRTLPIPIEEIAFGDNIKLGIGFQFNANQKESRFSFSTFVKYEIDDVSEPVIELETEIIFKIKNLLDVVRFKKDNELEVNDNFLATIAGVCIGTTRGVLATNTKGNPLAKFPLPILNPTELLSRKQEHDH